MEIALNVLGGMNSRLMNLFLGLYEFRPSWVLNESAGGFSFSDEVLRRFSGGDK